MFLLKVCNLAHTIDGLWEKEFPVRLELAKRADLKPGLSRSFNNDYKEARGE